jgi:hypothetical protein
MYEIVSGTLTLYMYLAHGRPRKWDQGTPLLQLFLHMRSFSFHCLFPCHYELPVTQCFVKSSSPIRNLVIYLYLE